MTIRVWTPPAVVLTSHKNRVLHVTPKQYKSKTRRLSMPPTPEQTKETRRQKQKAIEAKARTAYTCIREGWSVEEIVAQGFTLQQVTKYIRQHTRKYRRWRRAVWLFEGGFRPDALTGHVHASPSKAKRWHSRWQVHGTALPAVIPTGCEGIE